MPKTFYFLTRIIAIFAVLFGTPASAENERKLVFIPGIVGAVLSTEDKEIVWGNLRSIRRSKFQRMDLLPPQRPAEQLKATDALRDIPLVLGAFEVGIYGEVIDFLTGEVSAFDSRTAQSIKGDYVEGVDLFVFAYDWRRSNFANAVLLDAFIAENIPDGQYDIVAHSMGGILTRVMLSGRGPGPLCTEPDQQGDLSEEEYQRVCTAIYGAPPSGVWPSDHMSAAKPSGARLHTFFEIATPHYGSVNLAATFVNGWGKLGDLLLGNNRELQDIALSWAAPLELIPTYENCCARGRPGASGNKAISGLNEELWMDLILGFGVEPCPYRDCEMKRVLFRNGLTSRKIIDEIMAEGLPGTVVSNHGLIGRNVKNTREVLYASFDAQGDGDGIDFRIGAEGDGVVHRLSAGLPNTNQGGTKSNFGVVMRSAHTFISGNTGTSEYLYNTLINPVDTPIAPVSNAVTPFARGLVLTSGMEAVPPIMEPGTRFELALQLSQDPDQAFDRDDAEDADISVMFTRVGDGVQSSGAPLEINFSDSRMLLGDLTYSNDGYALQEPGVYAVELSWRGTVLAEQFIYVLEEE